VTLIQDDRQIDLEDAIARAGVTTADILAAETAAVVAFNAADAALDARMASLIGMATDSPYRAHVPDSARDKAKADCPEVWSAFYAAARAVAGDAPSPVLVGANTTPAAPTDMIQGLPVCATIADVKRVCGGTRLVAGITGYCRYAGPLGQAWLASAPRAPGREPTGGFHQVAA
jgi:hypothetical protein